ncbi:MAG: hypothetical protein ACK5MI_00190 [Mangrovibacterium sp.]
MKRKHLITTLILLLIWTIIISSAIFGLTRAIQSFTPEKLTTEQAELDTKLDTEQVGQQNSPFGHQVKAFQPSNHPTALKIRHFVRYFLTGLVEFYFPENWSPKLISGIESVVGIPLLAIMLLCTLIFITCIPFIVTSLFIATFRKEYKIQYAGDLYNQYEETMMEYLFGSLSAKEVAKNMRTVKSRLGKDLLIDNLMNYERNLSGEYANRVLALYRLTGLHRFSAKKIKSRRIDRRVKGIRELSNLYPSGALNVIQHYINDKNHLVRSEAQVAYASLDSTASYHFLDDLDKEFSTWTQLNILNYVKLHEQKVPSFLKWIDSPNNDVQIFCICMIQYFQQIENADHLIGMVYHPNRHVREHVYEAIKTLEYIDAKNVLIGRYFDEISYNRYLILQVFEAIGSVENIDFLLLALDEESSTEYRLLICKILLGFGTNGEQALKQYAEERDQDVLKYIDFINRKKHIA